MAGEIVSAALHARREDQRLIAEARTGLDQAAREVGNRLASARRGDVQNRGLIGTGLGGAALGMLLYAALAGPVARLMTASWHWPERRAMPALGETTMGEAGQRLMQTAATESWALSVEAQPLGDGTVVAVQNSSQTEIS